MGAQHPARRTAEILGDFPDIEGLICFQISAFRLITDEGQRDAMLYFTSDTHFNDPRVLRIDRRPFPSLAAQDDALIAFWNETVAPDDEVWHLGDFARGDKRAVETLLSRLNGRKNLIIGNNDGPDTTAASGWISVQHYAELTVDGTLLILCHYPFRTWNQMGKKSVDLHGHSHGKLKPLTRQFDVGVDARDFRPVPLSALLQKRVARSRVLIGE